MPAEVLKINRGQNKTEKEWLEKKVSGAKLPETFGGRQAISGQSPEAKGIHQPKEEERKIAAQLREAQRLPTAQGKTEENAVPGAEIAEKAGQMGTGLLLKKCWLGLLPSFGLTLIYINIHFFLRYLMGVEAFCRFGEQGGLAGAKAMAGGTVKGSGGPNIGGSGTISAGREILEIICLILLDLIVLFLILGILTILHIITHPGDFLVVLGKELMKNLCRFFTFGAGCK